MRKKILFFFVIAGLFVFLHTGYSQSCNCFNGWVYRMTITVTNNNPAGYTNFEVRDSINTLALISSGKMKADGGDIRFADSLCNSLNYFVESGINTNATRIWVKIPVLPSNGTRTIYMFYGNPVAVSQSNGHNTFAFYEGFDNNTLGHMINTGCGTGSVSFAGGVATFSWTSSNMWRSDSTFDFNIALTAEANVTAASGSWPGLYWARSVGLQSMAVLLGGGNVRISKTPITGTGLCNGHNFINPTLTAPSPAGLWAFTWVATGSQIATFPGNGTWTVTDNELPKDQPLRLCLGGISSGSGSYSVDWVRARRYAPVQPQVSNGIEISAPTAPGSLTATVLGSTSIRINWADNSNNEDEFKIERSTNGGTSWALRDSVGTNTTQYTDIGLTPNSQYCYRVHASNCMGNSANSNQACATTTITGIIQGSEIPKIFKLYQNYPNPFNPVTSIKFNIPKPSFVNITIYDALGRKLDELVNTKLIAGYYNAEWNASNYASGIYFYRIEAGDYIAEMKMVLIK